MTTLPARQSPRAGSGSRRVLRRLRHSPAAAHLQHAATAAFWPAVAGSGLLLGLFLLTVTRGQYVAWDGIHSIPTGGTR